MKASTTVLHPLYGIGIIKKRDFKTKRTFVKFIDRDFWGNHPVLGGWFTDQEIAIRVIR